MNGLQTFDPQLTTMIGMLLKSAVILIHMKQLIWIVGGEPVCTPLAPNDLLFRPFELSYKPATRIPFWNEITMDERHWPLLLAAMQIWT